MMRVSFDYDGTLNKEAVEAFAKELVGDGIEVWIVTSRHAVNNDDLLSTAIRCGINLSNIHLTSGGAKWKYFKEEDFTFHLDDDWGEITIINEVTNTIGVRAFGNPGWREECLEAIENHKL